MEQPEDTSDVESQFHEESVGETSISEQPVDDVSKPRNAANIPKKNKVVALVFGVLVVILVIVLAVVLTGDNNTASNSNGKSAVDGGAADNTEQLASSPTPAPVSSTSVPVTAAAPVTMAPVEPTPVPVTSSPTMAPTVCVDDWRMISDQILGEASMDLAGLALDMSADGSILAVGAAQNGENGERAGHVRVYRYDSQTMNFAQMGQDLDGEGEKDQFGYSVALDATGTRLAAGARWNDGEVAGENSGHVRVFDFDGQANNWNQIGQDIDGEAAGDQSGRSVALSADGSRLAVGATGNVGFNNETSVGHVRIYDLNVDVWEQVGPDIDGDSELDYAGRAVAISSDGNHVAVGAYQDNNGSGSVKVYKYDATTNDWEIVGSSIEGSVGDWAGLSVALSSNGDRVAVGLPGDNNRFWPGISKIYEVQGDGEWEQIGGDLEGGYSVAMSSDGTRVVVGDYKGGENGPSSGHTFVYDWDADTSAARGGNWTQIGESINGAYGDLLGSVVTMSQNGERIAVSAPAHEMQTGATRVFELC